MDAYSNFAHIYDELMDDVPYGRIADLIDSKIKANCVKNNIVLDLACGTGTLTKMLSDKGYEMIGADASCEMLQVAQEKNPGVLFLNQPMDDFELFGTVGAIVCTLDSVNYLLDDESLNQMFKLCNNYLEPNGLLIFDINTEYKFKNILGNNIFTYDSEKIFYTWENDYSEKDGLCDFYLTFFVKDGDMYERFDETHTERVYTEDKIEKTLQNNGFQVVDKFDNFTGNKAQNSSERIVYVCKNIDSIQAKFLQGDK